MKVVIDTNVFVAAGFNPHSKSARVIQLVRDKQLQHIWHHSTKSETKLILSRIPPIDWLSFNDVFTKENRYRGKLHRNIFTMIEDSEDRKFAALAYATNATLVTNDDHLLTPRAKLPFQVMKSNQLANLFED